MITHSEDVSKAAESYSEAVMISITELEDLISEGEKMTNKSHDIDVFQRYHGMESKLLAGYAHENDHFEFVANNLFISQGEVRG